MVGFPVVQRRDGVLKPQLLADLLKDTKVGLTEVFEHLVPLVNAHQEIALVGFILRESWYVTFSIIQIRGEPLQSNKGWSFHHLTETSQQSCANINVCRTLTFPQLFPFYRWGNKGSEMSPG